MRYEHVSGVKDVLNRAFDIGCDGGVRYPGSRQVHGDTGEDAI